MDDKLRGKQSSRPIYEEGGDIRLMSEAQRLAWIQMWEDTKPKINKNMQQPLIFGTP